MAKQRYRLGEADWKASMHRRKFWNNLSARGILACF